MAKRITSSSVDWAIISNKIFPEKRHIYMSFKTKFDKFQRQVAAYPPELLKIDFEQYRSKIAAPGVVDSFKKSYEALKIPYPSDNGFFAQLESDEKKVHKQVAEKEAQILKELAEYKEKQKLYASEIPYSQLSMDELAELNPAYRSDPDKGRLWPQIIDQDIPDDAKNEPEPH